MGHRPSCVPVVLRYYDVTAENCDLRSVSPRTHLAYVDLQLHAPTAVQQYKILSGSVNNTRY
eukprot:697390-Prymnesium_polylepis.1